MQRGRRAPRGSASPARPTEAIAEWQAARRRLEVVEMLEEVAFARLEADDIERDHYPLGA